MKAVTTVGIKGGSGKSTFSAALSAGLTQYKLPNGRRLKPAWVWADRYSATDASGPLIASIFGSPDQRVARWLSDRGFYVLLRESLSAFASQASKSGDLDEYVFIFDTGALLVEDAARYFTPKSQAVILPWNRSSAADGLSKLTDTISTLVSIDPSSSSRTHVLLNEVPGGTSEREAWYRKRDVQDLLSVEALKKRLLTEHLQYSLMLRDLVSPRQPVLIPTLKRALSVVSPITAEVVTKSGWQIEYAPTDAAELRQHLSETEKAESAGNE